jgi:hypothetical protein
MTVPAGRSASASTIYGNPLDETDGAGATNNVGFFEYTFFNGQRNARRDASNNISHLYNYVRNNPLNNTDLTGNACVSNGNGGFVNDNCGGQSCADVDNADRKVNPQAIVTADPQYLRDSATGQCFFQFKFPLTRMLPL